MKLRFLEKKSFENVFFENTFWILEQPVNNKGCSSIKFFLRGFYQE